MKKLELFFPFIAAYIKNREVNEKLNKYNHSDSQAKWFKVLKDSQIPDSDMETIAHNIYSEEDARRYNIESKGSSLLAGIGVSISLISIILSILSNESVNSFLQLISIIVFLFAILNLIFAAFAAYQAIKISIRWGSVSDDLLTILQNKKEKLLEWAAEHLSNVEYNIELGVKKSNWVDVAQQHFVRGLGLMVIGFIILFLEIFSR